MLLTYNKFGVAFTQLPQGSKTNNYSINVIIKIIDNSDGIVTFTLAQSIKVYPSDTNTLSVINDIQTLNYQNSIYMKGITGVIRTQIQNIGILATATNYMITNGSNQSNLTLNTSQIVSVNSFLLQCASNITLMDTTTLSGVANLLSLLSFSSATASNLNNSVREIKE